MVMFIRLSLIKRCLRCFLMSDQKKRGWIGEYPLVSVIMPAYDTEQVFFFESVKSILNQTYPNLEFIIVDDGLSEENRAFLKALDDPRVLVVKNETNMGQSKSSNKGFRIAKGKYIARMDSDDISLPERIERQVQFMEANPNLVGCCSRAKVLGNRGGLRKVIPRKFPNSDSLRMGMMFSCEMIHPTMFLKAEVIKEHHIEYDEEQVYAQDYMLWTDLLRYGDIQCMSDVLLLYRIHDGQVSIKKASAQRMYAERAHHESLQQNGVNLSSDEERLLFSMTLDGFYGPKDEYELLFQSVDKQMRVNNDKDRYQEFNKEYSYRIVKSGLKGFAKNGKRGRAILRWSRFWKSALNVKNWPFYLSSLFK